MRVTQTTISDNALYNIQQGRSRLDRLNDQISSGMNILRPSDDPISTRQILDLENKVKESDQYLSNITRANLWLNVTDTALTGIADIAKAIKGVASSITSGSTDVVIRDAAVNQLKELRKQLTDLANVQLGDQFIFGGFKNTTAPIAGDTANGSSVITNIDVTNLSVGMTVTGGGFPANTQISAITSGPPISITLNNPAGATAAPGSWLAFAPGFTAAPFKAVEGKGTLNGTPTVTGLNTSALSVGMPVNGEGIQPGTTIQSIGPNPGEILLSAAATPPAAPASPAVNLLFGGNYRGSSDQINVNVARNSKAAINISGSDLFSGAGAYGNLDMFATLDGLITAIATNNVPAIQAEAANFSKATQQISNAQGDVAGRLIRMQSSKNMLQRDQNTAKGIISDRQNVDYAKAAVELNQEKTAFEAALAATAKITQLSLLDYLR